ncbi:MAG: uroporphyrin-III C-methyltransferase [Alphaproteobacteria bacterium]|jgi:uroporphyrin-III C-methyltransferase
MLGFFGVHTPAYLKQTKDDEFVSCKHTKGKSGGGSVWLVGAGPGDVELLTIKAYKAIQQADVILFDWLVDESVLAIIPQGCETEFVGKRSGQHSLTQDFITQRILYHAKQGKRVVRLKGGDPAIFARTVEETIVLQANDIPFVIVPGITSASGASAYTGIPLTHRGCAQSVMFATASFQSPDKEPDWKSLANASKQQTMVFYMGLKKVNLIGQRLIEHGVDPSFPIAVIDQACTSRQQLCKGTLGDIHKQVNAANFTGPALIICGQVIKHQQLVDTASLFAEQALSKTM